jgi:hypothetical protein
VRGLLLWDETFPRTASMKIKRAPLSESLREKATKSAVVEVGAG